MTRFRPISLALLCGALGTIACERAKSANPLSPDLAGPIPGVAITAPRPLEPGQGAQVVKNGEPTTLVIENPSTSGQRALFLQIQLAADANFEQLVHHADRVEPGPNGRTAYRVPEQLGAGYTYFWRLRAGDGANMGPYSSTHQFTVIDPVTMETPSPIEPVGNIATNRPTFRVRNGQISGTTGAYYRFELATAPDPSAIVAVVTTTPGSDGETSISIGDLPYARTFYWRVHASDGTTQSNYSPLIVFTTPVPPSGPMPPAPSPAPPPALPNSPPTGRRAPNPPSGQLLPVPGYGASVVQDMARRYPGELARSCKDNHDWLFRLVYELRTHDTRWGLNWKRGHAGSMSTDIVSYNPTDGPDEGNGQVYIFDVIGAECEGNYPTFNDVTGPTWAARGDSACSPGTYCTRWTIEPYLRAGFPQ
jgi:hypothetical protein